MSDQRDGGIAWTEETWPLLRGCSRVDPDCENCYAEGIAARFSGPGQPYEGLARWSKKRLPLWTGKVVMATEHLADPLRWRRPRMVFANSMSDVFHESLTNEQIAAVFGVMAAAPQHTFQVLTKRAKRMREWFAWVGEHDDPLARLHVAIGPLLAQHTEPESYEQGREPRVVLRNDAAMEELLSAEWPLPNVWLGTSVGHQAAAHRIDELRACQAAVRFVSFEPLHGPVQADLTGIHWGIIGGESGHRARRFEMDWGREVERQLRAAGAKVFWKQLGAFVVDRNDGRFADGGEFPDPEQPELWPPSVTGREDAIEENINGFREEYQGAPVRVRLRDKKGSDPSEWPVGLAREFPEAPHG